MNINRNNREHLGAERPQQVRKIGTTRRSVSGFFMFRGKKSIPYESALERDLLIRLSHNRLVNDIIAQPLQLKYEASNGNEYPYTPDYLIYYQLEKSTPLEDLSVPMLVEVKYRQELQEKWLKLKPKFKAARKYATEQGWTFKIYDELRIRDQVWRNIMFLQRYKRMEFDPEETKWILDNMRFMGQATFDYILTRHFFDKWDRAVGISHVWHLLSTGAIDCDMSLPLNDFTELWVADYDE